MWLNMMKCEQVHEFNCLLKKEGNDYSMQVMEIPGIAVGGDNRDSIKEEIVKATRAYLEFHDETHTKAQQNKLGSSLNTSSKGIILGVEKISVKI